MIDDKLNQIRNKMFKLSSMGVDTQEYENELNSITSKKYNSYGDSAFAYSSEDTCDSEIIKLESELNEYDLIIELYDYCNKIKPILLEMLEKFKNEINMNDLNNYISKTEDYLINLYSDKNNKVSDKLLINIFEIVYYLIELEIIKTNKSTLYDFINDKHIDTRYINVIIFNKMQDINNIKEEDNKKYSIKKRLDSLVLKLNNNRLNINYFNIEIIKLLLMLEKNYDAYRELDNDFNSKVLKLTWQDKGIKNTMEDIESDISELKRTKKVAKDSKLDMKKKIISTMLTLSVILTGAFGIERGVRKSNSTNSYSKETKIISTLNDEPIVKDEEYLSDSDELGNEQYIDILSPWRNSEGDTISRNVEEYDLTYLGLPHNINTLSDIDIDSLKIEPSYYTETISRENIDNLQMYDEDITELRNVSYTYQGKKVIKGSYALDLLGYYILYLVVLIVIYFFRYCIYECFPDSLYDVINEFKYNKNHCKVKTKRLEATINEFLEYINQNKELREEFNKLFIENIDLLSDTEELKKKLDEVINEFEDYDKSAEMVLTRKKELEK